MNTKRVAILAAGFYFLLSSGTAASQWFHVRIDDGSGETVKLNLPMTLIGTVAPLIEREGLNRGQIPWKETELTVADLREIWNAVKAEGSYEFVTVESERSRVRVSKEGDQIFIRAVESGEEEVEVNLPVAVVDALLSGTGESLNIQAALQALAEAPVGELVRVKDGQTSVRVWIDHSSSSDR